MCADPAQGQHRGAGLLPLLHPAPVTLTVLVTIAGQRSRIEESFQAAKTLVALN